MAAGGKKFLLAARRELEDNGTRLVLADPWTGERYVKNEADLQNNHDVSLGDFVHANVDSSKVLYNITKTHHTGNILVNIEGNVAVVSNLHSRLSNDQEQLLFHNKLFGDSLCKDRNLTPGEYKIKINLLENPHTLPSGRIIHFEASEPESTYRKPIVGSGFAPAASKNGPIVGEGFAAPKRNEFLRCRAVVLSKAEKPIGTHYYLWNLDLKTEGLFVSKNHVLAPGHFFEGTFKKKPDGKCTCQHYERAMKEAPFEGGIRPNGKIYFTVKIDKYEPAKGNMKFAHATAKYIGEVLEGESEKTKLSADCNGKMVNIQRRGMGEKDFVWMITEIL